jgi:hypothetical protein
MPQKTRTHQRRRVLSQAAIAVVMGLSVASSATVLSARAASASTKRVGSEPWATRTVDAGQSARFALLINAGDRPLTISISGLENGMEAELIPGANNRYELVMHTSIDSPRGYFTVRIRARFGTSAISKSVSLEIVDPREDSTEAPV